MVKSSKSLEEIFSRIRAAKMVLMVMEEGEEAEGDLVMAGEKVTPDHVNFMARHARGVVSVALPERRMREMGIPLVASPQSEIADEQAGSLVEAREGVTTGISAHDRARTIQVLASDKSGPQDIVMPGPRAAADGAERRRHDASGTRRGRGRPDAGGRDAAVRRDVHGAARGRRRRASRASCASSP